MKFRVGDICKIIGNSSNYLMNYEYVKIIQTLPNNYYDCEILYKVKDVNNLCRSNFTLSFTESDLELNNKNRFEKLLDKYNEKS